MKTCKWVQFPVECNKKSKYTDYLIACEGYVVLPRKEVTFGFKFCPYCGKKIKMQKTMEEWEK